MTLTAFQIKNAKTGRHADGNGLYLEVSSSGAKSWILRYQINGRRRDMGLGGLDHLSAVEARAEASRCKALVEKKIDPLEQRREEEAKKKAEEQAVASVNVKRAFTFKDAAIDYIKAHRAGWKNSKHAQQWESTLDTYVYPIIGAIPVSDIDTDHVLKVLNPIWHSKTETASRIRNRIEMILDAAIFKKMRDSGNPARWKGFLEHALPSPNTIKNEEHQPALPYEQMADFMKELRQRNGLSVLCLEFAILTAIRSGTARLARWDQIDEEKRVWSPSAEIMKRGKEGHRVPLSDAALEVLDKAKAFGVGKDLIFFGRKDQALSDMSLTQIIRRMNAERKEKEMPKWIDPKYDREVVPHGFRSTFSDWAAEVTSYPNEMAELALAHAVGTKVEQAYRRGDMFEKRRQMMEDWALYCQGTAAVVHDEAEDAPVSDGSVMDIIDQMSAAGVSDIGMGDVPVNPTASAKAKGRKVATKEPAPVAPGVSQSQASLF